MPLIPIILWAAIPVVLLGGDDRARDALGPGMH